MRFIYGYPEYGDHSACLFSHALIGLWTCERCTFVLRNKMSTMPSLLDLPREILDEIPGLVLFTPPRTLPNLSCYDYQRRQLPFPNHKPGALMGFHHLVKFYLMIYNTMPSPRASLLLLNYQLNLETLSLLRCKHQITIQYNLDIAVTNDRELWPTWISVPL